jgi:hypothetical protein
LIPTFQKFFIVRVKYDIVAVMCVIELLFELWIVISIVKIERRALATVCSLTWALDISSSMTLI